MAQRKKSSLPEVRRQIRTFVRSADGARWSFEVLMGYKVRFEAFTPGDPEPFVRVRPFSDFAELEELVKEQKADGFVEVLAQVAATKEAIRDASEFELRDVLSAWRKTDPARFPAPVRAVLALNELGTFCMRGGIGGFVSEAESWATMDVANAAEYLGLPEIARLWGKATRALDLAEERGRLPVDIRFADRKAAEELQRLMALGDVDDRLLAFVRAHAEDFVL